MAIYEIEKLKDELHVQDESPNPQIYALFKMGQELEQQGSGGGSGRTMLSFNSFSDYQLNIENKLKVGDVVIFNFDITVNIDKTIRVSGVPFTYIANKNFKGCTTCKLNSDFVAVFSRIRIDSSKTFEGLKFALGTIATGSMLCEDIAYTSNANFVSFSGTAFIYDNN